MISVTETFLQAIRNPHTLSVHLNLFSGTHLVQSGVQISTGTITADRNQRVRRQLSCDIPLAADESIQLNTVTSRVQVWLGYDIGSTPSVIPVGVFRIDEIGRLNREGLSVSGSSMEAYVVENIYAQAKTFPKDKGALDTIKEVILDSLPDATFSIHPDIAVLAGKTLPYDIIVEPKDSPWDVVETLAFTLGADVYCSPTGKFVIRPRPKIIGPDTRAVARIKEGPDGVLMVANIKVSRDESYNAVLAMGQSSDADIPPHSYHAKYEVAASPMRWGGPFGKKTKILEGDKLLTTVDLCRAKAEEELARAVAVSRKLDFGAIPNPALEPDDIIEIDMLDGTTERHMLTRLSIPLGLGDWTADTLSTKDHDALNPSAPITPDNP